MIGVGHWHKYVPTDLAKNIHFRILLLKRAQDDPLFQRAIREVCKRDILFYINAFVFQINPLEKGRRAVEPFICRDYQVETLLSTPETNGKRGMIWCYLNGKSLVLQKSRELGATWFFLILQDWLGLFHDNVQMLDISRSEEAVTERSPKSLFGKIRFMHDHLPHWLRGGVRAKKRIIGFDRTGSEITGEASTGKAGVGGRAGLVFADEVSKIAEATEVRQRTASTADCRFFNSTHEGTGTEFYELTRTPEMVQWTWHWTQHPEKRKGLYRASLEHPGQPEILDHDYKFPLDYPFVLDGRPTGGPFPGIRSPWYDQKCADIGSQLGVSVELDINPEGSVEQFFDAILLRQLIAEARSPSWEGIIEATEEGTVKTMMEQAKGHLKFWCRLTHGKPPESLYFIGGDYSQGSGATPTCFSIFDGKLGEKVGEYTNAHIDPIRAAWVMVALARLFHGARLIFETQGPSGVAAKEITGSDRLRYFNVHMVSDDRRLAPTVSDRPGWDPRDKLKVLTDYRQALRTRECVNHSVEALKECAQIRFSKGEVMHEHEVAGKGKTVPDSGARLSHADHVIADALVWKIAKMAAVANAKAKPKETEDPRWPNVNSLQWRRDFHDQKRRELEAI